MKLLVVLVGLFAGAWTLAVAPPVEPKNVENTEATQISDNRAGVLGGPHDFSALLGGPADACKACHITHVQTLKPTYETSAGDVPLAPSVEVYRTDGQRDVFQPDHFMPGATSLLCLGCHDGTVTTSTIGSSHALLAGRRAGFPIPDDFVWRDHPIGVSYPDDHEDYRTRAAVTAAGVPLPEGRIECVSCHDPHNANGLDHMLVVPNTRSALCLTCHVK